MSGEITHKNPGKCLFMGKGLFIWALMQENLSEICEQQRRRPACTYVQSDQRLCYSRIGKHHIKT